MHSTRLAILVSFTWVLAVGLCARGQQPAKSQPAADAAQFFESHVRPILVENCFSCHGPQKQRGGLRLDSAESLKKGSDTGPVVVPGKPGQSLLVRAIGYTGETKMPPKGKLPGEAIETLTAWVKMGAPWPTGAAANAKDSVAELIAAGKEHWAFQPVRKPALPRVKDASWAKTPIDLFVLASLEPKQLSPSAVADKRTLLRRVTLDLIGLPPTPEEVAAFEADSSPDAFAQVVDRLLASPQHGERWARHWLDVARYADTKGYVFTEERRYPFAYTYRDYVIRALNEDVPYDRFILEQIAADRLPRGEDKRPLAALGYLTLGRRFLNNVHDIIDDRIDVVARGFLGLTVTCARCHDHKFDPIPSADYYSLYGVFASSVEPSDLPLIGMPERSKELEGYQQELQAREKKVADYVDRKYYELRVRFRTQAAEHMLVAQQAKRAPSIDRRADIEVLPTDIHPAMVRRWMDYLQKTRATHHPVLAAWHAFAVLSESEFAAKAPAVAARLADSKQPINARVAKAFAGKPPASLQELSQRYGDLFKEVDRQWQEIVKRAETNKGSAPTALADPDLEAVRQVLYGPGSPAVFSPEEAQTQRLYDRTFRNEFAKLRTNVEAWKANPIAPPRAMALNDAPTPQEPHVFLRGNPNTLGPAVPRQFLAVVAGGRRQPFKKGSGRLELAQAIASPDNPLTARVFVNRLWLHHFGKGLVQTPSDFGLRGETPTHPDLLDYLAATLMEDAWSIKKMHRTILLSSAYQQRSDDRPEGQRIDPENRLLWRMNRQRLEFEALRDSLIAVTGRLNTRMGGAAAELTTQPFTMRRSIYGFIERQNLPGLFRTFDFASPDTSSPKRHSTTVPQQALFLMNSPFVVEQARNLIERPDVATCEISSERIDRMYRLLYGRSAEAEEVGLGSSFVEAGASPKKLAWEEYAQVLLLANEFMFVD